ncbi:MAG: hypothetical protein HOA17_01350 [Candidatus Melainabacteria bacterium]|jgi:hypothetical protein|nr:hypothetical protein [Candidatus Melainabacteria bacterium]
MKKTILILIFVSLCMSQPGLAENGSTANGDLSDAINKTAIEATTEAELDYQEILDLDQEELQEQSIQKGEEFIETIKSKEAPNQGTRFLSLRNEFPETIKIVFQTELSQNNKELYLHAYEDLDTLSLQKDTEYRVHVYNVHGQSLGQLRENVTEQNKIKISPFLLVKKYIFKPAQIKVIKEEAKLILTIEESPVAKEEELKSQAIIAEPVTEQAEPNLDEKRSIKIANISDRDVHIDIIEPDNQAIGSGWTIHNDIYEPQFLNYGSKPIKLSASAKLILKPKDMEETVQEAKDLIVDERGNFIWLIKDLKIGAN